MIHFLLALAATPAANAAPARILHQTENAHIVRLATDERSVVWQEVGGAQPDTRLFTLDLTTKKKGEIRAPKRPFGPALAGPWVFFGAGNAAKKVDALLHHLESGKSVRLDRAVPWIIEPAIQVTESPEGPILEALWDRSDDLDGNGLEIRLHRAGPLGSSTRVLVSGPVLRRDDIPPEYHRTIHNEYPEISGSSVVFQNNEFGVPNIYRLEMLEAGEIAVRVAPSNSYQERPAIDGPVTVWEESEKGFSASDESAIFAQDNRTGTLRKLNQGVGFHYQVRVRGNWAVYGAKREPSPSTPSVRAFDLDSGVEFAPETCFPGAIFDSMPTSQGIVAAQRFTSSSSRLLFATWEQIRLNCR